MELTEPPFPSQQVFTPSLILPPPTPFLHDPPPFNKGVGHCLNLHTKNTKGNNVAVLAEFRLMSPLFDEVALKMTMDAFF